MSDTASVLNSQKLTSQHKVSLETLQKHPLCTGKQEKKEIKQFEQRMEEINRAFTLVNEIRVFLETSLEELS